MKERSEVFSKYNMGRVVGGCVLMLTLVMSSTGCTPDKVEASPTVQVIDELGLRYYNFAYALNTEGLGKFQGVDSRHIVMLPLSEIGTTKELVSVDYLNNLANYFSSVGIIQGLRPIDQNLGSTNLSMMVSPPSHSIFIINRDPDSLPFELTELKERGEITITSVGANGEIEILSFINIQGSLKGIKKSGVPTKEELEKAIVFNMRSRLAQVMCLAYAGPDPDSDPKCNVIAINIAAAGVYTPEETKRYIDEMFVQTHTAGYTSLTDYYYDFMPEVFNVFLASE
jgi:hypothetical protein